MEKFYYLSLVWGIIRYTSGIMSDFPYWKLFYITILFHELQSITSDDPDDEQPF